MAKRGQITIFIVLGILLLLVLAVFFFLSGEKQEPNILNVGLVQEYVQSCLKKTLEDAVFENSKRGGYFVLPEKSTAGLAENVPYYFDSEENIFPLDELLAQQLAKYVDSLVDLCVNDFPKDQGYNFTFSKPSSQAVLTAQKIILKTNLPLTIAKNSQVKEISSFATEISAKKIYPAFQIAKEIVKSQKGKEVCLSCFSESVSKNGLFVNLLAISTDTYLFDIESEDYFKDGEKYHLRFAVRYGQEE